MTPSIHDRLSVMTERQYALATFFLMAAILMQLLSVGVSLLAALHALPYQP